jgi:hypothetical protein
MATLSIFISNVDDDTYDRSDHKGHDEWWGGGFACTALPPDERSHRVREIDAWHMHDFYFEGNIHGVLGLGGGSRFLEMSPPVHSRSHMANPPRCVKDNHSVKGNEEVRAVLTSTSLESPPLIKVYHQVSR